VSARRAARATISSAGWMGPDELPTLERATSLLARLAAHADDP
jgi:hypothetical protein